MKGKNGLLIGLVFLTAESASGEPRGYINRRTTTSESGERTPRTQGEVIVNLGKEIDVLKKKVDEWGTMSFSPVVFAPADLSDLKPFQLLETDPNATDKTTKFTLNGLFKEYNISNGTSQFAQRTKTDTQIAAETNSNQLAAIQDTAKVRAFRENLSRQQTAHEENLLITGKQRDQAATRQQEAVTAAAEAAEAKADADQAVLVAMERVATLEKKIETAKPVEGEADAAARQRARTLAAAELEFIDAKSELKIAQEEQRKADANKKDADEKLATATKDLEAAEAARTKALGEEMKVPTTLGTPTVAEALKDINVAGAGLDTGTEVGTDGISNLDKIGDGSLLPPLGNTDDQTPAGAFPVMARINAAASALTVKNIHTFLGNPEAALKFQDKRILFGVSTLSINPGWRTKRDFKGMINAQVAMYYRTASPDAIREIVRCPDYPISLRRRIAADFNPLLTEEQRSFFAANPEPAMSYDQCRKYFQSLAAHRTPDKEFRNAMVVHAVTPMVDAQNLDLTSSIARQDEIALYLAASLTQIGSSAAGKFFSTWSKMRRKDVATKTTVATANSTTLGGGAFGFEIGTRLRGLDDDDAKGNKAAQTLDRQTFPVLLMMGIKDEDAKPYFMMEGNRIVIKEVMVRTNYSTHWARMSPSFWRPYSKDRKPSDGYAEVINLHRAADVAQDHLAYAKAENAAFNRPSWTDPKSGMVYAEESPKRRWYAPVGPQEADGIVLTQERLTNDWFTMQALLYGSRFDQTLPAAFVFNSYAGDETLHDPEGVVKTADVGFNMLQLDFEKKDQPRTVILKGKRLNLLNPETLAVSGEGIELVGSAKALGSEAISFQVKATSSKAAGDFHIVAAHRYHGTNFLSPPMPFSVGTAYLPEIHEFADVEYDASGTRKDGKWEGKLVLLLQGSGLDQLNETNGKVLGGGIDTTKSNVAITWIAEDGRSAKAEVTLNSTPSRGAAFLSFKVKPLIDAGAGTAPPPETEEVQSRPFKFRFISTPSLVPWSQREFLASGKANKAADKTTFSGTFQIVLQGQGLDSLSLETSELRDLENSLASGVTRVGARSDGMVVLEFDVAAWEVNSKTAYLKLPLIDAPSNAIFTQPAKFRLVTE